MSGINKNNHTVYDKANHPLCKLLDFLYYCFVRSFASVFLGKIGFDIFFFLLGVCYEDFLDLTKHFGKYIPHFLCSEIFSVILTLFFLTCLEEFTDELCRLRSFFVKSILLKELIFLEDTVFHGIC